MYTDAFFLAGALGAFVLLEGDHRWAAALVAAIPSGARQLTFAVLALCSVPA